MSDDIKLQVGVKVFLKNSAGKYLLVKRNQDKYKNVAGCWDIIGGRIDPGTLLIENLRREVYEETKLNISSEPKIIYAQDILRSGNHVVRISYSALAEGEPILDMAENISVASEDDAD